MLGRIILTRVSGANRELTDDNLLDLNFAIDTYDIAESISKIKAKQF